MNQADCSSTHRYRSAHNICLLGRIFVIIWKISQAENIRREIDCLDVNGHPESGRNLHPSRKVRIDKAYAGSEFQCKKSGNFVFVHVTWIGPKSS